VWVVWDMLWEAHWLVYNTTMHNKYCTIHNTDTVAYATRSGSYPTECKNEVHWYTTITAVHNTYMKQKHLGYLNVKLLQP